MLRPIKTGQGSGFNATSNNKRTVGLHQNSLNSAARAVVEREEQSYAMNDADMVTFTRTERAEITFDETQLSAGKMITTEQFACLIGSAGTGKTSVMANVIPLVAKQVPLIDWGYFRTGGREPNQDRRPAIALCTFTNVAAKNLASKLPKEWASHCMSIHSLLCYRPEGTGEVNDRGNEKMIFAPAYNSGNKMPVKAIFIDETGILSRDLWHNLLNACEPDTRIYLLGDLAQLPAIQGVSPLPFAMKKWPTVELLKIYRQSDDSEIVPNLTRIRKGLFPVHHPTDFRCGKTERLPEGGTGAREYVKRYIAALFAQGHWDPRQDIILTAMNAGMLGQEHWNGQFRFHFNPPKKDEETGKLINPPILVQTAMGAVNLAVGDKVMATDNGGRTSRETRFNNGSIGVITAIYPNPNYGGSLEGLGEIDAGSSMADIWSAVDEATTAYNENADTLLDEHQADDVKMRQASHIVSVVEISTGDVYELSRSAEIGTLSHAYAATTHKFQGSQARNVIVICHSSAPFGLNREALYTACSRARKTVFLLHDDAGLNRAITNGLLKGHTAQEKADRLMETYKNNRGWAIPRLPEPNKIFLGGK